MSETGTASSGMSEARQPCRKIYTTMMTSSSASHRVVRFPRCPRLTASVVSSETA